MKIDEILKDVNSVIISGHVRPDGDCIGSCLGLYNYIIDNYSDIKVSVYMENKQEDFMYINGMDKVITEYKDETADIMISLDTSSVDRIGVISELYKCHENTLCIDHHISNPGFAKVNIIKGGLSSCSEVLYYMMDDDKISKNTAMALYTGIIHDSGVFKYQSTTEDTMNAAGKLMKKGIDFTKIIDEGFYSRTYKQNQILGRALLESYLMLDGKCIVCVLNKSVLDFFEVDSSDLGGIAEQLRLTTSVECAVFAYETGTLEYKVSMRSKNYVDVNEVAQFFGGGGHVRAAGATIQGNSYDIINNIVSRIAMQI